MSEPLPGFYGKRFLTTYLTITGFGAHGDSGDESSKEQLYRSKVFQTERKAFDVSSSSHLGQRSPKFKTILLGSVSSRTISKVAYIPISLTGGQ